MIWKERGTKIVVAIVTLFFFATGISIGMVGEYRRSGCLS